VLRLSDTAGIRETEDIIEGIGVQIAEKMIGTAELVIGVFDGGCPLTEDDLYLINKINNKKSIAVINKNDVSQQLDTSVFKNNNIPFVLLSAKENTGIEQLKSKVEELFRINDITLNSVCVANERQKQCIVSCLDSVNSSIAAIDNGELLDAVNVLVDEAEQSLLELTGKRITDTVVDEVFSRFCVGK
jgi:tRNA modification GTPase